MRKIASAPIAIPPYLQEVNDLEVLTTFPIDYSREANVLLRRLAYLKLIAQDPPHILQKALSDVEDIYDVCIGILDAHNQDIDYLIKSHDPNYKRNN